MKSLGSFVWENDIKLTLGLYHWMYGNDRCDLSEERRPGMG